MKTITFKKSGSQYTALISDAHHRDLTGKYILLSEHEKALEEAFNAGRGYSIYMNPPSFKQWKEQYLKDRS